MARFTKVGDIREKFWVASQRSGFARHWKTVRRFWDNGWYIKKSIQDYIASVESYFDRKINVYLFPNVLTLSGI